MATKAMLLKEEGNKYFQAGDFGEAERLYTRAIQKDPSNPKLFTNRAMTRIKLQSWEACIDDCIKSIELEQGNMKGYYYLAQAQLALRHPNEALNSALTAYEECLRTNSTSTRNVSTLVLQAKKEKWEAKERDRIRRRSDLLRELEDGLRKGADHELHLLESRIFNREVGESEAAEEKIEIETSSKQKIEELWSVFAIADPENMKKREVPDYMIDNISFAIMHDPVTTTRGQSYEKSTMLEHLRRSETDPLTREPLRVQDLRPNLALKQACEEFLENNG
ncbi:hypothetical protein MMC07_004759, partial [Pseudocyphellaria aurata]|nr:hypothetical protein [Pseudocyphellaria aurata]